MPKTAGSIWVVNDVLTENRSGLTAGATDVHLARARPPAPVAPGQTTLAPAASAPRTQTATAADDIRHTATFYHCPHGTQLSRNTLFWLPVKGFPRSALLDRRASHAQSGTRRFVSCEPCHAKQQRLGRGCTSGDKLCGKTPTGTILSRSSHAAPPDQHSPRARLSRVSQSALVRTKIILAFGYGSHWC